MLRSIRLGVIQPREDSGENLTAALQYPKGAYKGALLKGGETLEQAALRSCPDDAPSLEVLKVRLGWA